ncbi:MAG TPA: hypothetical protein VFU05_15945 [Cyclobacteriaceae bacterium]|nr:hypothetical protein [Cyclobacteriaceae bacterium]
MIDLRFGFLFPWHMRLVSLFTLVVAFAVPSLIGAIALFLASVFVLVSSEGTEVNVANSTFREYTSYVFLKSGKFNRLPSVEKIFITKGKESQTMYSPHGIQSTTIEHGVHNAYLKFSTGEKIHLLRAANKKGLIKKLIPLSEALKTDIVDHS